VHCAYIFSHCACSFNWYQGATAKPGKTCGSVASITYEMRHRKPDKEGNPYPTLEQCYITVTKTANSNQEWTNLILKKVILPGMGMKEDGTSTENIGLLWDELEVIQQQL